MVIGVHGQTGVTGAAVFGEATGDSVGVYATSKTVPAVKGVGAQPACTEAAPATASRA